MKSVYIMAEIGVNHNGNMNEARKLIDVAKLAGCDGVKFQVFEPEEVREVWNEIEHLWLDPTQLFVLKEYCGDEIDFHCSAFGKLSAEIVKTLHLHALKIPSGLITDIDYLTYIRNGFHGFILSTGMSNIKEVKRALRVLGSDSVIVLHCTSAYPTPLKDVNLKAMLKLKKIAEHVGISDHTEGITVPIAAAALGAECIEKHITLDKLAEGPDHAVSLNPLELYSMVQAVRDVEILMGNGKKKCQESEKVNLHRRK